MIQSESVKLQTVLLERMQQMLEAQTEENRCMLTEVMEENRRMVREEMKRWLEKVGTGRKGASGPDDEQPPTN